ncbi:hypothetical protein PAXRUDRAFT_22380 [Paxillus rubicundulus Ve08.2h10]|uniref:Uncharacterized protein n=1 Tax=Paxillus rubicundulus Ve08.2h10 TaxID=930991 RepID=A0A0D0CN86_9AGAM|nr:hypothetical protein PAXRUDRAFT_22380 [Paxillus rubicundulus Ve08.2h10]
MSSNTASADTPTCPTLIGPSNFQIWKLQITAKHLREKVLGVALGTDTCQITSLSIPGTTTAVPVPAMSPSIPGPSTISPSLSGSLTISGTATVEEVRKWMERNKRAHGIIQDSISNALLLKTEMHTTTKDLFNALLSIHQALNLTSAFYIFQQLFNSVCLPCRNEVHGRHQTPRLCPPKLPSENYGMEHVHLLHHNTVEDSKLTFDAVETQITLEEVHLNPSGSSDSALKVFNKSSARPHNVVLGYHRIRPAEVVSYAVPHKSTPPLWSPLRTKSAFSASPLLRFSASPLLRFSASPLLCISAFSLMFSFLCLDFLSFTSLTDV